MKYRIGIDLGGTNIKVGVVDEENRVVMVHSRPTLVQRPWNEIVQDMAAAVHTVLENALLSVSDCVSCGVGSPGIVDAKTGEVVYSNNFDWTHIPLGQTLQELLQLPVCVSNDANCATLGECVGGAAKGVKNAVLFTLGTGVGGGVVVDGKIFESAPGGVELGHVTIVEDGEVCTCGRKGCLEAYCSATALIREAQKAEDLHSESSMNQLCAEYQNQMNGVVPFAAAQGGDIVAQGVVNRYIKRLSIGVVNMVNVFRPEVILLSGGVCAQGRNLTEPIAAYVKQYSFGGAHVKVPEVKIAQLGNDAGILGAANLE